ncbi:aromatic amino acid lyase [Stenotrophomonas sp. NPDC087984]
MSSSAVTLAGSVHAGSEQRQMLRANHRVTALSFPRPRRQHRGVCGNRARARAHPGQAHCAAEIRGFLALDTRPAPSRRIQDPYGVRAFLQVQGPALERRTFIWVPSAWAVTVRQPPGAVHAGVASGHMSERPAATPNHVEASQEGVASLGSAVPGAASGAADE